MPSTEMKPDEILSVIREEGYSPQIESDGDISFKIKGTTLTFGTCANGFVYGRIYYNLKREYRWPALLAAQHVELSYVAIKVLVVSECESLIFSVESLCGNKEGFRVFFNRTISILSDSVRTFADKFSEYEADEDCNDKTYDDANCLQNNVSKSSIPS